MYWKGFFIGLGFAVSLAGCLPGSSAEHDEEVLAAFIERAKAQMVFVEGGTFLMGDQPSERGLYHTFGEDNKPAVEVTLDSYSIGAYEISYEEFDFYTEYNNLPKTLNQPHYKDQPWRGPEFPASTSWNSAKNYCLWLAELTDLPFDLPTEAQWEFAARSRGEFVLFATDDGTIKRGVNYSEYSPHPKPSGTYPPNPLGLYDMSGNTGEWVNDWYDERYYDGGPYHNPEGPETGTQKVIRGSSVLGTPESSAVIYRSKIDDLNTDFFGAGFRCVVNSPDTIQ